MKFYVRHDGGELMFPSFKDFESMYRMKLVGPDDTVRRENSERWVRVGDLPELRLAAGAARELKTRRFVVQLTWAVVGVLSLIMLLQFFFHMKPITLQDEPPPASHR